MPDSADSREPIAGPILGIDTGSPRIHVAVVKGGRVLAERSAPQRAASQCLLTSIEEVLADAAIALGDLKGLAVLRGPGSFTGLRIGLATVLGLQQSTGLPAAAVGTLPALAAAGTEIAGLGPGQAIVSAVDALRGEWTIQRFSAGLPPIAASPPSLVSSATLESLEDPVVGHGIGPDAATAVRLASPSLGSWAARIAAVDEAVWDAARLTEPLYARPPAVTPERTPKAVS